MKHLFAFALLAGLTACVAPGFPADADGDHRPVLSMPASLPSDPLTHAGIDAWAAPREPFDTTSITPVESVGASRSE